jgi:hypothetical protein
VKKLKKFKRYAEGGALGAGEGDPFSYTDFSDRARSLRKPSEAAPIEEAKPYRVSKPEVQETKLEPVKTEKAPEKTEKEPAKERGETDFNYEPQRPYNQALEDAKEQGRRARDAFKLAKPAADKPINISTGASGFSFPKNPKDAEAGMSRGRREEGEPKTTTSSKPAPKAASPNEIPTTEASKGPKGEEIDNSGRFAQAAMALPPLRGTSAGIRGALTLARMIGSASKAEGQGTGKAPEAKPDTVSAKPAVERVKEAKIEGPPVPPKPKTVTEEMGLRDTPSMERMRKAKEAAKEGPPEPLRVKTSAERKGLKETPSMERMRKAKEAAKEGPPAPAKTKTPAEEMGLSETSAMEKSRKANEGPPDLGARSRRVAAAQKRSDLIPAKDRDPGFMKDYIAGRAEKRNRIKDLPNDGLDVRYENKKGGKIPAFKKGGLVGRGDGCAQRGKTKGRMV